MGSAGLATPDSVFVVPLVMWPRSLSKPVSVPCGPLYFPSVTVLSHHPSVLFRVSGGTQKALFRRAAAWH